MLSVGGFGIPAGTISDAFVTYFARRSEGSRRKAAQAEARTIFRSPVRSVRLRRGAEANLLRAERGIVPFGGRDGELADFDIWFNDQEPMKWRLLTGPSGRGKTRFMQHVVNSYLDRHGDRILAGFINLDAMSKTPQALAGFLAHEGDVLLVIDYAERAPKKTAVILKLALALEAAADGGSDVRVRVVLIARGLSDVWKQIGIANADIGEVMDANNGQFDLEELPPLAISPQARHQEFKRAYKAFDRELFPLDSETGQFPAADEIPDLTAKPPRDDFEEAVMIHLAALATVLGEIRAAEMTATRLLDWLINRERGEWRRRAGGFLKLDESVFAKAVDEAMGVVTLVATASEEPGEERVADLLGACPLLCALPPATRLGLGSVLGQLHPGENGPIGLTPDLIGTYFLGLLPGRFFVSVFPSLSDAEATNGLIKLNWLAQSWRDAGTKVNPIGVDRILLALNSDSKRLLPLAIDVAEQTGNPIGTISAKLLERTNDLEVARYLHFAKKVPRHTTTLREVALAVELILIRAHRPEGTERSRAEYVRRANALSASLADVGRFKEALAIAEDATRTCRELVTSGAGDFTDYLAMSLNNLSLRLRDLLNLDDALAAVQEAVSLRRTLSASSPDVFISDLAVSLNNMAIRLSDLGNSEEALKAIEEAVLIYRGLVSTRPGVFTSDFAMSLNTLSLRLCYVRRFDEALRANEEALSLYRSLASARPEAFNTHLARALNNRSNCLAFLNRNKEALVAIEEAVALRRELASRHAEAFTPDLVKSISNLSGELSVLGRHDEALAAIDEAIELRRALASAHPETAIPDLARSSAVRGEVFLAMGLPSEARGSFEEFFTLISPNLERYPAALGRQTRFNLNKYRQACQASDIAPDRDLIDPLRRFVVGRGFDDPFADDF